MVPTLVKNSYILSVLFTRRKIPDCLVEDFCKLWSVNWMAAGSRLPRFGHGTFSDFSNTPYLISLPGCRTRSPTNLQHLCCEALINITINKIYQAL